MPRAYSIACAALSCAAFLCAVVFFVALDAAPAVAASAAVVGSLCVWLNGRISERYDLEPETYKDLQNLRK